MAKPLPAWVQHWARRSMPRALRNWLRNPRASARWLRSQWAWRRGTVAEMDFDGLRLRCHPESARTFGLFLNDPAQVEEWRHFRALLQPGVRLLDLGAHYGFFSAATLTLGGDTARVLAVEPSAQAAAVLRENLRLAAGAGRAQVLQAAVGAVSGRLAMLASGPAGEGYMFASAEPRADATRVQQYDFAALERAAGWTPTLVKCDIEGYEFTVLSAPANLAALARWHAPLLLELHCAWIRRAGDDPEALLRALAGAGFHPDPAAPLPPGVEILRLLLRESAIMGESAS